MVQEVGLGAFALDQFATVMMEQFPGSYDWDIVAWNALSLNPRHC